MRNLRVVGEGGRGPGRPDGALAMCVDPFSQTVHLLDAAFVLQSFSADGGPEGEVELDLRAESPDVQAAGTAAVVGMDYVQELEAIAVAFSSGQLLTVDPAQMKVECVGDVDSGLLGAAWAPDQELLALVTGALGLVVMTKGWEVLAERPLHGGAPGPEPALAPAGSRAHISWRGDGRFFAVSAPDPSAGGAYRLRVFSREGPSGNLIAVPMTNVPGPEKRRPGPPPSAAAAAARPPGAPAPAAPAGTSSEPVLSMFERNGLRHGQCGLRGAGRPSALDWSGESDVLAVAFGEGDVGSGLVHLYSFSNGHWYLKAEARLASPPAALRWDPVRPYRLHVACADGGYARFDLAWDVAVSDATASPSYPCSSAAAVIDGARVLLTPLRRAVVPPPMCGSVLSLPSPASEVAWAPDGSLAVLLSDGTLLAYDRPPDAADGAALSSPPRAVLRRPAGLERARHAALPYPSSLVCVAGPSGVSPCGDALLQIWFGEGDPAPVLGTARTPLPGNRTAAAVALSGPTGRLYVLATDGAIFACSPGPEPAPGPVALEALPPLPAPCARLAVATPSPGRDVLVCLQERGRLYVDGALVASDATSAAARGGHLLFTARPASLRVLPLDAPDLAALAADPAALGGLTTRAIERGSRLVTAARDDPRVVLQAPRGNLETVYPRALVLDSARTHLNRGEYGAAFRELRSHRVDLALLYEHSPERFLASCPAIVQQVNSVDHINLLLSSLRRAAGRNAACDAIRAALDAADPDRFLLSALTALREAAARAAAAAADDFGADSPADDGPGDGKPTAEQALAYLIFLCDSERLYAAALGLYDLNLALMVAQELAREPAYQRFTIDRHLGRHARALANIARAGPARFGEALEYMRESGQTELGARLYPPPEAGAPDDDGRWRTVLREHGRALAAAARHADAARGAPFSSLQSSSLPSFSTDRPALPAALLACGEEAAALAALVAAGERRAACALASRLGAGPERTAALGRDLAAVLRAAGRNEEAAMALADLAGDTEAPFFPSLPPPQRATLRGTPGGRARPRRAARAGRGDLAASEIRPRLSEAAEEKGRRLAFLAARLPAARDARRAASAFYEANAGAGAAADGEGGALDDFETRSVVSEASTLAPSEAGSAVSGSSSGSFASAASSRSVFSWSSTRGPAPAKGRRSQDPVARARKMAESLAKALASFRSRSGGEEERLQEELRALASPPPETSAALRATLDALLFFGDAAGARRLQAAVAAQQRAAAAAAVELCGATAAAVAAATEGAVPWALPFLAEAEAEAEGAGAPRP
eukprot:tig00000219_g19479.t2